LVQIVWSWRRVSRSIEHIGSAHDEVELAALKTAAGRAVGGQILTLAHPSPDDLNEALTKIGSRIEH
jgi:hypothetical protein